jgi:hypothetical protein
MSSSKIKNNNKTIDALNNVFKFCGRLPENIDVSMELQLAREEDMGDKIIIGNKEFVLDEIGYYIGKMDVWEKETDIFLEIKANEKDVDDIVFEKINWLNKNKSKIIDTFMEENDYFIENINDMIKSGDFAADREITEKEFIESLFVNNVTIYVKGSETDFMLDLDAAPDYLMGHLACMEIDSEYGVECGGING